MSEIEQLINIVDKNEAVELKVLYNAQIQCLAIYKEEPTVQKKRDWDAAKAGLDDLIKHLNEKYVQLPEQIKASENGATFQNIYQVVEHLSAAGFKISKSKLYRDKDKGMIRINSDGTVAETEVRAYAATLERKDGDIGDLNDIHARKTAKEVERLEEQIAKLKFEREKEEGRYIPRVDFEAELAARAAVLDSGFRHAFHVRAQEWIAMVGGRPARSADFLTALNQALDEQLNTYATTHVFQVVFRDEEE